MIDSGVDPNPDTETAVIGSQALWPDTDTLDEVAALAPAVQPGGHPDGHGTLMAMIMAAPQNGWGMVGLAPTSVRVYNLKALPAGALLFPAKTVYLAVDACQRLHESAYPSMKVINLSLGGEPSVEASVLEDFARAVASARAAGMSIVAAAGDNGANVLFPASYGPVLAVGGADAAQPPGALCSFSARGAGLDLLAPGCDTATGGLEAAFQDTGEPAFGSGDSQASTEVSTVESSIDAYKPELTLQQTEACLTSSAQDGELDVARAFDACGLERVVQAGEQAELNANTTPTVPLGTTSVPPGRVSPTPPTSTPGVGPCPTACATQRARSSARPMGTSFEPRCPSPRLRSTYVDSRVRLGVQRQPIDCRLQARVGSILHGRMRWSQSYSSQGTTLLLPRQGMDEHEHIQARLCGHTGVKLSSPWVKVVRP